MSMNPNPVLPNESNNDDSTTKWEHLVRQFLSQQNKNFLERAILEAKKINEPEIADYLQAFADDKTDRAYRLSDYLIPKLNQAGRLEESLTISLMGHHTGTVLVETFIEYPYDRQKQVRETGIQACQEAIQISQILKDRPCQAMYSGRLATGFADSRQPLEAEYFNTQALQLYRDCVLQESLVFLKDVAITLNNLGIAQSSQRKLGEAEASHTEALKIRRKLAETEPQLFLPDVAMTLNNLGVVKSDQRKLAEAENSYSEALEIYQKLAETEPRIFLRNVAMTLNNLGTLQWEQRELLQAEASFVEALRIRKKLAKTEPQVFLQSVGVTLNNLGYVQWEQRKLAEAEVSYSEALEIRSVLAETEPHIFLPDLAMTLNNFGILQWELGRPSEAEISYDRALEIYLRLAETEPQIFLPDVAMTLNNLGNTQSALRKPAEAQISFAKALEIRKRLAKKEPHIFLPDLAMTLINLGVSQSDRRSFTEAETSFAEALEIYQKLAETEPNVFLPDVARTLNNLGDVERELQKIADSEKSYTRALHLFQELVQQEPHIFNEFIAQTLNGLGYLRINQNRFAEAKDNFESARDLIEDLRTKAITIDDRSRMLQGNTNLYSNLLDCYVKMKDWKKALEIAEQGKSRSLSDLLDLKSEGLQPKAPTPDVLALVKNLGRKYSDTIKELQRIESCERYLSEQISQLEADIKRIKVRRENDEVAQQVFLQQIFEEKQPLEQKKRKVMEQRFVGQAELKKVLDKIRKYDKNFPPKAKDIDSQEIIEIAENLNRTIVIFRVLSQSTAIIFVFPNGKLKVKTVSNFGQDNLFELFYHDWLIPYQQWKKSGGQIQSSKEASFQTARSPETKTEGWLLLMEKTLDNIYKKLMIHVHQILKLNSSTKEVLFVPSKSLAILPLHAASWKDKNDETHYFLEEFTISYCPSVSVFKRCQENEKKRTDKTLLINNPTGDLKFSEKEVEFIKKIYQPNTDLRRKKALKTTVLKALQNDYSFTHFACHGFYNSENQFDSGLIMSNGIIKLSEIINCNLQNNWLTTLSACETGVVDFASSTDEHFGLPLGFIFAGSPSVWASLWSVSDETTALLMQKAYENLSKKEFCNNKPEALRQAQLSILRKFSHPYYWAGFQHYGM